MTIPALGWTRECLDQAHSVYQNARPCFGCARACRASRTSPGFFSRERAISVSKPRPWSTISCVNKMKNLQSLLEISASHHPHLCPRQVLDVRLGLVGADASGIEVPQNKKTPAHYCGNRQLFRRRVEVATGCTVGHRTPRVEDYGKISATFVDTRLGRVVCVAPNLDIRHKAFQYTPYQEKRYFTQLEGYKVIPIEELAFIEEVVLAPPNF